jgi:hypothetical protein
LPTYSVGWVDTCELTSSALAPEATRINKESAASVNQASYIAPCFIAVLERSSLPRVGPTSVVDGDRLVRPDPKTAMRTLTSSGGRLSVVGEEFIRYKGALSRAPGATFAGSELLPHAT